MKWEKSSSFQCLTTKGVQVAMYRKSYVDDQWLCYVLGRNAVRVVSEDAAREYCESELRNVKELLDDTFAAS